MRLSSTALLLCAGVAIATGCGHSSSSRAAEPFPNPGSVRPAETSHIVVVVMENREYSDVMRRGAAAYLSSLARRYATATSFYAITHPSLPNYLALTSGSTHGVTSDCTGCHFRARNLVDQLEAANVSWKAYMDGMPRRCFKGSKAARYVKKHNPFMYYDDVSGNPHWCAKVVPGEELGRDLLAGRLPTFAWVTPDLCEDTHDCSIQTGDRYLRRHVPALLRALGPHGILFVTWDEGTSNAGCCGNRAAGGHIATVIAGPEVRQGSRLAADSTHYSTLRTIEQSLGLSPLRGARSHFADSLTGAFAVPPSGAAR